MPPAEGQGGRGLDGVQLASPGAMLWAAAAPVRGRLVWLMVVFVLTAWLGSLELWLVGQAVDRALMPALMGHLAGPQVWTLIWPWVLLVGALGLFTPLVDGLAALALKALGQELVASLRHRLLAHVLGLELAFFDGQPAGRIANRLTADVEAISEVYTAVAVPLVRDLAAMLGVVVALLWMDPILAGVTLAALPLAVAISQFFRPRIREAWRALREGQSEVVALGAEQLAGAKALRLAGREAEEVAAFGGRNAAALAQAMRALHTMATYRPLIQGLSDFGLLSVLVAGAWRFQSGALSLGELSAFIPYQRRLLEPIQALSDRLNTLQAGLAAAERVAGYLARQSQLPPANAGEPLPDLQAWPADRPWLEFDGVWFAYGQGPWVLKGISFALRPGEQLGVVGSTGAGKSTLLALATRMHDPQRGEVRLGGLDLRSWPAEALREAVGLVIQEGGLFSASVAFNLSLGQPQAEARLAEVAERLGPAAWWAQPGAPQELGGGSQALSAGQAQLLALGRALALAPPILALDEATAAIDPSTEATLQGALAQAARGKAWLVVAHRLATVRGADHILVLDGGHIVEEGRHDELVALGGLYAGWWAAAIAAGEAPSARGPHP
jgi:ATP-binding cassette subfamily B multidrug efflux pump